MLLLAALGMTFATGAMVWMPDDDEIVEDTETGGGTNDNGSETSVSFFGLSDNDDVGGDDGLDGEEGNDLLLGGADDDSLQGE